MKKFKWSEFVKKNVFKKIGWVFLVFGILGLIPYVVNIVALFLVKDFQTSFLKYSIYERILIVVPWLLAVVLYSWQILISKNLIKNNKYNKQILYYVYGLILIDLISFVLFLPLEILYMQLLMAVITWWILIKQDNSLSRWVKNIKSL